MNKTLLALALGLALAGCRGNVDDGTKPKAVDNDLPSIVLQDDTPNLMLTWIDDRGETHVELHPADVPSNGRALVRVVVADREDGTHELFWVADLTKKDGDGGFVVNTMRRTDWEDTITKRREAWVAKHAPPPPSGGVPAAPGTGVPAAPGTGEPAVPGEPPTQLPSKVPLVVIYGAEWCGACHQAARWLKSHNVAFIEKDVDTDPKAVSEMKAKLAKAGMRYTGSIPVIDVGGQMMIGFSPGELNRLLQQQQPQKPGGGGTVL